MNFNRKTFVQIALLLFLTNSGTNIASPTFTKQKADNFTKTANNVLTPAYPYLAQYIVDQFQLSKVNGVGIDVGGGPGNLVFELAQRTNSLYWINSDINPYYFNIFSTYAEQKTLSHRVGFITADAQSLPFKDNYADIIVSRGSFQFWPDKKKAFADIYRILKPGGTAFIGRGFSPNTPVKVAKGIRAKQGRKMPGYDIQDTENELVDIMKSLNIPDYKILKPEQSDNSVKYGIWLQIKKEN